MTSRRRIALGLGAWLILIPLCWRAGMRADPGAARTRRFLGHFFRAPLDLPIAPADAVALVPDAPIMIETPRGLLQVGRIGSGDDGSWRAVVFPEFADLLGPESALAWHATSGNLEWVFATLFPPERLDRIRRRSRAGWRREKRRFLVDIRPGLETLAGDLAKALEEALPVVLEEHREDLNALGRLFRDLAWRSHLRQVFQSVIWPRAVEASEPAVRAIQDEILDAFPVWALSWAVVVQALPFTDNARVKAKIGDFLREKALPIVRSHLPELKAAGAEVIREMLHDPRVTDAFSQAFQAFQSHPEVRAILTRLLDDWVVENGAFRAVLRDAWSRPALAEPLRRFLSAVEPDIRGIADEILLDEQRRGINPDLARVLRRQLLREDRKWARLIPGKPGGPPPSSLPVRAGGIR
ncbi:MAG TPA: hypothetical protein ENK43_09060 [Planctomycetes bacterium]|nr:hypothetical protein [Planctomycetota bacterium]